MAKFSLADLVQHPFSFAVGVGLANGLLAKARGKKIDLPTGLTLSAILGLGEMALVVYEPESERAYSLPIVGLYSVLGVLAGIAPFVTLEQPSLEDAAPALLANTAASPPNQAVSGWAWGRPRSRTRRRR